MLSLSVCRISLPFIQLVGGGLHHVLMMKLTTINRCRLLLISSPALSWVTRLELTIFEWGKIGASTRVAPLSVFKCAL